jgi:hypothetical protein
MFLIHKIYSYLKVLEEYHSNEMCTKNYETWFVWMILLWFLAIRFYQSKDDFQIFDKSQVTSKINLFDYYKEKENDLKK